MDVFGLLPHSCQLCREIEIDGTLDTNGCVTQSFLWTLPDIQTKAKRCILFNWTLQLPARPLKATDGLRMYISTDHEDLENLQVEWKDAYGELVPLSDSEQTSLHIFAEEGKFRKRYSRTPSL
jgi:hypothetical protein